MNNNNLEDQNKRIKINNYPKISVVIPAYNEEDLIGKTLESIRNQSYKNFIITVVDNNSTDKTVEIAKKYGAKIIYEKRQGAVFAYDTGIRMSTTRIVAITDADSQPRKNWLEKIASTLSRDDVIAVTGSAIVITNSKILSELLGHLYSLFVSFNFLIGKPHISGFNFAIKKDYFSLINGMDLKFKMSFEVDLGLRLKQYGKVVFKRNLIIENSPRRWKKGIVKTLYEYALGYVYTVWFRIPPPFKQNTIR